MSVGSDLPQSPAIGGFIDPQAERDKTQEEFRHG